MITATAADDKEKERHQRLKMDFAKDVATTMLSLQKEELTLGNHARVSDATAATISLFVSWGIGT